jgi:hypothetical protein
MNTVRQEAAVSGRKTSTHDLSPSIGVNADNHLLVASRPTNFGVFSVSGSGYLPTRAARWFRVTNATSGNLTVMQRTPLFHRGFDGVDHQLTLDSQTITVTAESAVTPDGESNAIRIIHNAANSAYAEVPFGFREGHVATCYFKNIATTADISPLGLYSNWEDIDINHPAIALQLTSAGDFAFKVGSASNVASSSSYTQDTWYRVRIKGSMVGSSATALVSVDKYVGGWTSVFADEPLTSHGGAGVLDELYGKDSFVLAFSSQGTGTQIVDNLEVYIDNTSSEDLPAGATKEYDCRANLDEYSVSGAASGYYRS